MAYENHYYRPDHERINYHQLEQSSISSRAILITIGVIGLGVAGMFLFGEVSTNNLDASTTGQILPPAVTEEVPLVPAPAPAE